jgi:Flp pilus assembly pilin Flp
MAPTRMHHPMQAAELPADIAAARRRAIAAHPAGRAHPTDDGVAASAPPGSTARVARRLREEQGAMAAEYGLLVVVGATICSLVIRWASGGAVFRLLDDVLQSAGRLLGL